MHQPLYEQTRRPWAWTPTSEELRAASAVWVVTLTPEDDLGTAARQVTLCARYALALARQPECLGVGWTRSDVTVVYDVEGGVDAALALAWDRPVGLPHVAAQATDDPAEWDWATAGTERIARLALGTRHQCQSRGPRDCLCRARGNERPVDADRPGERGFLLGRGAWL